MKKLEVRTTKEGQQPEYTQNLDNVLTFLRHPEDKISVRNGEQVNIDIYENGECIFSGDKYELFEKLKA